MPERLSYEASCARLREIDLLGGDDPAPMPPRMPAYDDEEPLGVNFFRTMLGEDDINLSNLTLRRTFFGRSEIRGVKFRNTDLSESCMCWNDFIGVDFTGADLAMADLRASLFQEASFVGANLDGADLRGSPFESCDFSDASMKAAVLTRIQGHDLTLAETQRAEIDWRTEVGEEPGGG